VYFFEERVFECDAEISLHKLKFEVDVFGTERAVNIE
jgi:hypothetical protein